MALTTRCLDCGTRTKGSRCPPCRARRDDWQGRRRIGSGWAWGEIRDAVCVRDRVCVRCGSADRLQVHHRIPLAQGGTNDVTSEGSAVLRKRAGAGLFGRSDLAAAALPHSSGPARVVQPLALDDVVDLEHFGLTRKLDPGVL